MDVRVGHLVSLARLDVSYTSAAFMQPQIKQVLRNNLQSIHSGLHSTVSRLSFSCLNHRPVQLSNRLRLLRRLTLFDRSFVFALGGNTLIRLLEERLTLSGLGIDALDLADGALNCRSEDRRSLLNYCSHHGFDGLDDAIAN